jgi:hypothetical protein
MYVALFFQPLWSFAKYKQRINLKTARAELCGEGKQISQYTLEGLEADIQAAKASGDSKKKKFAKRRWDSIISAVYCPNRVLIK